MIRVRNPHSVLAALETRPREVQEILLPPSALSPGGKTALGEGWEKVLHLAREHDVRVSAAAKSLSAQQQQHGKNRNQGPGGRGADRHGRDRERDRDDDDGGRVGVAEAVMKERDAVSVEELFEGARERGGGKGLWLALDCLQDPHNVGAIFRAAAFFGVQGILITQDRSAPLTGTVYDVACGGLEHVPFTIQPNLQRGFEKAKDAGLWILGTSEHARDDLATIQKDRPWLLVIGNEEKGMRRLTEESCDVLCRIAPAGKVTSLNASVAAGIFISRLA